MGNIVHTMTNRRYAEACVVSWKILASDACSCHLIGLTQ